MLSRDALAEILSGARSGARAMQELLRDLAALESPSTDAAGVRAVAGRLERELTALGLACELLPVPNAGPILRARGGGGDRPPVMLLGHLDTVWPLGTLARRPIRGEGERLFAPGAFDMKGGLVIAVHALRLLATRGLLPRVTVFFTPLEEVDCEPYRSLMESEMKSSSAVLDFEPAWPGGAVKTERKGSGSFVLRARGRAAHAGADFDKGASAVLELARQVLVASALTDRAGGVTVNVGVIHGGIRPNVVPDHAEAHIDVRYRRLADGQRVEAALRGLVSESEGVSLRLEGGLHYPPLERSAHVLGVYRKAKQVADALGLALDEVSTGGASEASFAAALGIPTLDGLGADGDGAHAEHEHVILSSLPERAALSAGLIAALGGV
jgi:glutamate carboxypeptidase